MIAAEEGLPPVIMFAFDDYFPAVAATDLLVRVRVTIRVESSGPRAEVLVLILMVMVMIFYVLVEENSLFGHVCFVMGVFGRVDWS